VPSNTLVRDLTAPDPPYGGRGARPKVSFTRVDRWCAGVPEEAWQTIEVRDGEKGPTLLPGRCPEEMAPDGAVVRLLASA